MGIARQYKEKKRCCVGAGDGKEKIYLHKKRGPLTNPTHSRLPTILSSMQPHVAVKSIASVSRIKKI